MKQRIIFCIAFCACSHYSVAQAFTAKNFAQLQWLTGNWKMAVKNGTLYEQWHVKDDSTLQSKGFIVKNSGDTILLETVQIQFRHKMLYYVPTVNGQNINKPVVFTITSAGSQSFTAENPAHDFPQKIYYERKPAAKIYAAVSGLENGTPKTEEFNFTKE